MNELKDSSTQDLLKELDRRLPKEKVKKFLERRKEMKEAFKTILKSIASKEWEEPVFHYRYPSRQDFNIKEMLKWFEATELYYNIAKRYESQERGSCCSVDRAYHGYLKPRCKEFLKYLTNKESFARLIYLNKAKAFKG